MSAFSGLNTAYTGLVAARAGLDIVGQNIANAHTAGYTRQRVTTSAIGPVAATGPFGGLVLPGEGVSVDSIARLGSLQLDARVRSSAAVAGYSSVRANTLATLETSLREPGADGISGQLNEFWAAWQDLANSPGEAAPSAVLLQLAREVAECGPFLSGVGGYVTRWNAAYRHLAFDRIHEWCQRYWGLDVQDPDAMSWLAPHGLPGSNWLTLVGWPLLDLLGKSAPELKEGEQDGVTVSALSHGFLVRAGEEATVGDLNRTEMPVAYLAAARRLSSGFVVEPPSFGGAFARKQEARLWFRRMVDSLEWAA